MESIIAILSMIFSVIAIAVSYYSFRRTHKTSIQPILVFINQGKDELGRSYWYVENMGNGPALNVLITGGNHNLSWSHDEVVLLSAIQRADCKRLGWISSLNALVATYTDALGQEYTTVCVDNQNRLSQKNLYPELKPVRYQWQLTKREIGEPIDVIPRTEIEKGKK